VAPELAKSHRVIAVDLKGFGQSDKPFDGRYSVFDQAELLAQLIEDKDLRNLTLVGHSFGGGIALLLALEANQRLAGRISRLVLLDTIAQVEQHRTLRKYDSFMKTGRVKFRGRQQRFM
jgi:pimeloyl-ACP methyl ester carboxylesterase